MSQMSILIVRPYIQELLNLIFRFFNKIIHRVPEDGIKASSNLRLRTSLEAPEKMVVDLVAKRNRIVTQTVAFLPNILL